LLTAGSVEGEVWVYGEGTGEGEEETTIAAIARRLGELMCTLMKKGTAYEVRHFKPGEKETEELVREAISA
jgi:hypothetical protein